MVDEYFNRPAADFIYDSYIEYLYAKKSFSNSFLQSFVLKLISCPLCLTTWMSILSCLIFVNIFYCGIVFIMVRSFDTLLNFFLKVH